jgi:hypothetical protein
VPIISTTTAIEIQSQEDPFLALTAGGAAVASGVLLVPEGALSMPGSLAASATGVAVSADGAPAAGVADGLG